LFVERELSNEPSVGTYHASLLFQQLDGVLGSQFVGGHQIGRRDCGTSRYSCLAVHENIAFLHVFGDEFG
jgi:hypothetical protein